MTDLFKNKGQNIDLQFEPWPEIPELIEAETKALKIAKWGIVGSLVLIVIVVLVEIFLLKAQEGIWTLSMN